MTLAGQANRKASYAILDAAFEGGIRFLDTADAYPIPMLPETHGRTEILLGTWMALRKNRHHLVLATKGYFPSGPLPIHRGNARLHLMRSCESSLKRLKTDYVDLYLCHGWDPTVPIEETLLALDQLRRDGKIVYAGLSNVRSHEVAEALVAARRLGIAGIQGVQPRYNVFQREAEESLFPLSRTFGLGTMVYNPIAGGLLSGKHQPGRPPARGTRFAMPHTGEIYRKRYWDEWLLREAATLKQEVEKQGLSLVTAAVAWVLSNPDVTSAIIGASRRQQLADHLRAPEITLPPSLARRLARSWFDLPRRPPDLDTPRLGDWYGV